MIDLLCAASLVLIVISSILYNRDALGFIPHAISLWVGSILANAYSTPDLDLHRSIPKRRWGTLSFIWEPYRLIVGKHRGFLSHGMSKNKLVNPASWSVGSFFRVIYLILIAQIVISALMWVLGRENLWFVSIIPVQIWIPAILGVLISDFTHVVVVDGFLTRK